MGTTIGTVKWFDNVKGYGFIVADRGGPDIFVHYTSIDGDGYRNLVEGDSVSFDLVDNGKGPQAKQVRRRASAAAVRSESSSHRESPPPQVAWLAEVAHRAE